MRPVIVWVWHFWAIGFYRTRRPGKFPTLTIGIGPMRAVFVSGKRDPQEGQVNG